MVRVSTIYDKDIKEQVFMIRGDERYARSTKTVISLGTRVDTAEGFVQSLLVNVFRDVGNGSLIVYDNDVVVYTYNNWQSTDTERTITLPALSYGIEHEIKVKYTGNGRCSPSMSKSVKVNVENPFVYVPTLTLVNDYSHDSYPANYALEQRVDLTCEGHSEAIAGQTVKIYYDDVLINTQTTQSHGHLSFNLNTGNRGKHTIKVELVKSNNMYGAVVEREISAGYKVSVVNTPSYVIFDNNGQAQCSFDVRAEDYLGRPVPHVGLSASTFINGTPYQWTTGETDSRGLATLNSSVLAIKCDGTFKFKIITQDFDVTEHIPIVTVSELSVVSATPRLYVNTENVLTASIGSSKRGVPVTFKDVTWDTPTETILTNDNGVATKTIKGRGINEQEWIASVGNISERLKLPDYYHYWECSENVQIGDYTLSSGASLLKLPNYFKLYASSGRITLTINVPNNVPYTLEIQDVYASAENSSDRYAYYIASGRQYTLKATHKNIGIRRDSSGRVGIYEDKSLAYTVANQNYTLPVFRFNPNTTFVKLTVRLEED